MDMCTKVYGNPSNMLLKAQNVTGDAKGKVIRIHRLGTRIHRIAAEILQSGAKWWTNQLTDQTEQFLICRSNTPGFLKPPNS